MPALKKLTLLLIFGFFIIPFPAAQDIPAPMEPPRMLNDFSGLLNNSDREKLEKKLQSFYFETSTQIYIVILDDLSGYDISDFTFQLGDKWKVGTKGKDNGAVILLNPSSDRKHGKAFIATGYGLEGAVPDAVARRIVDLEMIPWFKKLDYYSGLDAAATTLIELCRGEYTADEYLQSRQSSSPGLTAVSIILFIILFTIISRFRMARQYSAGHNIPLWTALFLASGSGTGHRGSFGNFSSGSSGFGGGFGGGGGGSFGGGGAGGSW